jgi:hypothetical protein
MIDRWLTISFFADAIFLGIVFHQFVHWWQYSRTEDGWVVKTLVVSLAFTRRWITDTAVLLDGLQRRYLDLVSHESPRRGTVADEVSLAVWIFHMFVYGFGSYLVFMEIGCESRSTPDRAFTLADVQGCRGGS